MSRTSAENGDILGLMALAIHVVALLPDLILQQLWVPLGPDNDWWCRWQQMDALIEWLFATLWS
jgi:hypothetical protein